MKTWGDILSFIVEFYDSLNIIYPDKNYKLNNFTFICDVKKAINADIFMCRSNDGKKGFVANLKRLYEFKKVIFKNFIYSVNIDYLMKYMSN